MKIIADKTSPTTRTASLIVLCFGLLASVSAFGASTLTWTGADSGSPNELGDANNWTGNTLPSPGAGDIGQWDGSVAGNLALTYSTGLGGSSGNPGVNFVLTSSQTGDISISSTTGSALRVNNFTNNSSSAAFAIGSGSGSVNLVLGGSSGSTQTWINNSTAAAAINQSVQFNMGGGGGHNFILGGTGDWNINTYLANVNTSGSLNLTKNNTGSLVLNPTGGSFGAGPVGTTTINVGTLQVQTADAFQGGSAVTYSIDGFQYGNLTVNTNGILDLNGQSLPVNALNGYGTIASSSGAATLTVGANGDNGSNFGGVITNGAGSVSLVVAGTNLLILSGTNTYTGGTTVNSGTLLINGQIAGNATVASGASFGGTGTIPGNVNWSASGSTLTLVPNQPLNLTGNATLNNNGVVVYVPGVSPLAAGTYTLMTYTPANVTGSVNSTPVAFIGAGVVAGTYSISMSGGTVTLTVTSAVTSGSWTNTASGNWSAGANWSSNPNVPHAAKDTAILGAGTNFTTATLDAAETVGSISFTNAASFAIANAGNTLTLDNSGSGATINVTFGSSNMIGAPIFLNDNATVTITPSMGNVLSLTNVISGASGKTLTVASGGVLGLSGNNTYGPSAGTVGTTLSGGTVLLGNSHALGSGDVSVSGGNATIQFGAPMTLANNIQVTGGRTLVVNDGGNAVTLSGAITGGGAITYGGSNTVTLANVGTLSGITANGSGHVILNGGVGTICTNLTATGIGHPLLEIASGPITYVNHAGAASVLADDGGTTTIDAGVIVNCTDTTVITVGNTSASTNVATLNVNGTLIDNSATFLIARNGTGVVNVNTGGLIYVVAAGKAFDITQNAGVGTLNLNGGTLITGAIGNGSPTTTNAIFNFNGGTLKATNTTSSGFWNNYNYMNVYVRNGGGIIDNNGINITNKQPYLHSTNSADNAIDGGITYKGSGVTTLFGETNTYTGPTIITAGTLAMTNAAENPVSTISISNGAVLNLINPTTNVIGGLILGGVSQAAGIYNLNNASGYITGAGGLQVVPVGPIAPTNSPTITQISLANISPSGGNVIISGTNGNVGATYYLLATTNLAKPLAQWKTVATNVAGGNSFTFTETNAVTAGAAQQFYILSSTNYNP